MLPFTSNHTFLKAMRATFFLACFGVAAALIVIVNATKCHHEDITTCTSISCNNGTMEVGCVHDTCTCVLKAITCQQVSDCGGGCNPDQSMHCFDNVCQCMKLH
ncbi:uncharacterized protein LOC128230067 [Mya arenaria]|uniref:uncharacterized protein LOC128230067 n=1 Tax=Mya arenaria TaxID=6604 RepID=UPI0022DF34CC|nr:uncharacterized protein LOC128230067 [Mya arenaria]